MATYYVDTAADPGGDGTTQNLTGATCAFKTLAQVSGGSFSAGDSVLFKRGCTWKGEVVTIPSSGDVGTPITFGNYGATGANPLIDPTVEYNDWTLDSGAIWKRTAAATDVRQMFEDGARLIYAANTGGMVAGSFAMVTVTKYVWCSDSGNPNTGHVVDYVPATNQAAFNTNGKSHLVIDGIDFTKTYSEIFNIETDGQHDITVRNCNSALNDGLEFCAGRWCTGTTLVDITFDNCTSADCLDASFWIGHGTNLIVENCESANCGKDVTPSGKLYPAAPVHYPSAILMAVDSVDCIVRGCYVHDMYGGPLCLDERGTNGLWTRNLMDATVGPLTYQSCMKVEGVGTTVCYNIILHAAGYGIEYLVTLSAQTDSYVYNNVIYGQTTAVYNVYAASTSTGIRFKNNILYHTGTDSWFMSVAASSQTGADIDYNCYYGLGTSKWRWTTTNYTTLATWQAGSSQDAHSLNADPKFITPGTNFRLQASSPCIDTGTEVGFIADIEGNPIR